MVHLGAPDAAAHRDGGDSEAYLAAARACDAALGRLASALPDGFGLVVTSDHGCTRDGGHGGPEPEVVVTPLVTLGPGFGAPTGDLCQRDLAGRVRAALGLAPDGGQVGPGGRLPACDTVGLRCAPLAALAVACAARLWSGLGGEGRGSRRAFGLNDCLWAALGGLWLQHGGAALGLLVAALAGAAAFSRGPVRGGVAAALAVGAALGFVRLHGLPAWERPVTAGGSAAWAACGLLPLAFAGRGLD